MEMDIAVLQDEHVSVTAGEVVEIPVLQKHINEGLPRHAWCCPLTLAMREKGLYLAETSIEVLLLRNGYTDQWDMRKGGIFTEVPMNDACKEFVRRFDRKEKVEPFTFHIHGPSGWVKRFTGLPDGNC